MPGGCAVEFRRVHAAYDVVQASQAQARRASGRAGGGFKLGHLGGSLGLNLTMRFSIMTFLIAWALYEQTQSSGAHGRRRQRATS